MRIKTAFLRRPVILGFGLIVAATTAPAPGWSETITFMATDCPSPYCRTEPLGSPGPEAMLIFTGRPFEAPQCFGPSVEFSCTAFPWGPRTPQEVILLTRGERPAQTWVFVLSQAAPVHPGARLRNVRIIDGPMSIDGGWFAGCQGNSDTFTSLASCSVIWTHYAGDLQ